MTTRADTGEETVRHLSVDGVRFSYRVLRRTGTPTGPVTEPAVVIGGALQGMHGWPQMDDHLGAVTDVVTADLPGMGGADPLPPGPAAPVLRRALTAVADGLGAPRVNLFGFSYGSALAHDWAVHHPGRVARLALGGLPLHVTDAQRHAWQQAVSLLEAGQREEFAARAADALMCLDPRRHVHRRELARRYVRRSFLHALASSPHAADALVRATADRPGFGGTLSAVRTLVFAGEHDTVTPAGAQREFAAAAGAGFRTLADSDHWVVLERADDVAELVAAFFTDRPLPADRPPARVPGVRREEDPAPYAPSH
ncbi:alpha/beta fold hydrolase [uncultured Streptomyces sp.]|uniref:alpha/beta fold hydrolase n=1 Tax=uncultured Streptomyces sp. TaxID=174707 RepID=UPI0026181935|nr:alpha/beta hydrolase [uncultured Streptomyces sp.]